MTNSPTVTSPIAIPLRLCASALNSARSAVAGLWLHGFAPVISAINWKNCRLRADEMPQLTGTLW